MKTQLFLVRLASLVTVCVGPFIATAFQGDAPHPFQNAKEGDWVKYKDTAAGLNHYFLVTKTVVKRTPTSVTVQTKTECSNKKIKTTTTDKTFELEKPLPLEQQLGYSKKQNVSLVKLSVTEQKLTIAGKTLETTKTKYAIEIAGKRYDADLTVWTVDEGPLTKIIQTSHRSALSTTSKSIVLDYGSKPAKSPCP